MDTHEENRQQDCGVADIAARIPGFEGYSGLERRLESDSLVRSTIASRLDAAKIELELIIQTVAAEKRLDLFSDYEGLKTAIEEFQDKLGEPPGDCGNFFQLPSLTDEDIVLIYRMDLQLLEKTAEFLEQIHILEENPFERNDARNLDSRLRELVTCFTERAISMKGCHQDEPTLSDS